MNGIRVFGLLLLGALGSAAAGVALAQNAAPEPASAGDAREAAAGDERAAPAAGAEAADEDAPLGAAEERAAGDDIDEFIPSEEIPPDEQVTFPADI